MQIKFNILTIFTLLAGIASGQIDLEKEELKLNEELLNFRTEFTAAGMDKANISFASKMKDFLLLDGAYTYTFKHLETVAILDSPDGKIRIVNWNVEYPDFSYSFGGFVLHKNNKKVSIFELKDGQQFELENGRKFLKIKKRRTRFECKELDSGKIYLFSPHAEVVPAAPSAASSLR